MRNRGRVPLVVAAFFASLAFAQDRVRQCADCHGADGNSPVAEVPSIAGQPRLFIETQLILYREGVRQSEKMLPVANGLKDAEIGKLAEHFAKLPAKSMESAPADAKLLKQGMERAQVLRCGVCHASNFQGQSQIPRLAGQREDYLAAEMRAYRDNTRTGADTIMAATLYGVSDADIKALAHFLARRP